MKFDQLSQQLQALQQHVVELLAGLSVSLDVQQQLAFIPTALNEFSLALSKQQLAHEALERQHEELSAAYLLESRYQQPEAIRTSIQGEAVSSAALLRLVITKAPIILYAIDSEGTFTLSEGKGLESLGLKPGEVVGHSAFELHQHQPEILAPLRRVLAGTAQTWQGDFGGMVYENRATPLCDETGQVIGLIGVATDITECCRVQAALKASEERFRCLSACSPIGIFLADVEGHCNYANPCLLTLTGLTLEEMLGQGWVNSVHPDERNWVLAEWVECTTGNKACCQEYRFRTSAGITRWVRVQTAPMHNDQGQPIGYVGTVEDITERQQSQQAIKESEKRFRQAVDFFPDTFVIYDKQRRFQFINATGLRLTGLPESALLGHTDEEIHPPEITNAYLPLLERTMETKQQQVGECSLTLPSIGQITFIVNYVPLLNEQGEIEQILGITYDITRRKQLEDERTRLIQQLESERAQLEAIISSLPDAVYIGDASGIWKCNEHAIEMLGFTSADDLKHNIAQLAEQLQNRYGDTGERIPPEDEVFAQALQGTASARETIVRHLQTGCDRIIRSAASPIRCGNAITALPAVMGYS